MKKIKVLSIVLIMLLQVIIPTMTYAMDLNIQAERPYSDNNDDGTTGNDKYTFQRGSVSETVWKIYDVDDKDDENSLLFSKALYCLRGGIGFGDSETIDNLSQNTREYTLTGNMKENAKDIIESYIENVSYDLSLEYPINSEETDGEKFTPYNAILWIVDNAYIPFDIKDEDGNIKYNATAYKQEFLENTGITNSQLTDDDIEVVQQMALWYFSNYDTQGETGSFSSNTLLNISASLGIENYEIPTDREQDISDLYSYLVTNAKQNSSVYQLNEETGKIETENKTYSKLNLSKEKINIEDKTIGLVSFKAVGPFELIKTEGIGTINNVELLVKLNGQDITTTETEYNLYAADDEGNFSTSQKYDTLEDIEVNKKFYIIFNEDITSIQLDLSYTLDYYKSQATLWQATNVDQPVVMIEKELVSELYTDSTEAKLADLALKKYITSVNDNIYEGDNARLKLESTEPLKNGETDATYAKATDLIVVEKEDLVTYAFRVYNEGEVAGTVNAIIDYIPEGLEFVGIKDNENNVYKSEINGNKLIITKTDETPLFELEAYDKVADELPTEAIEVVFKVTKNPTDQIEILKNIATMDYEFEDENIDIDSIPDEIDVDNYPDNENIEDDDDYEKIVLNPQKIADIALKKYITKVGNTNIDREPEVDTTPIKEGIVNEKGQLNAIYSKVTEPIVVEKEDLVTYAFRVYNEGEVAGTVNAIIDYIPEGIEFVEIKDNDNDVYKAEIDGNKLTITKTDETPLFELEAYDKVADELPTEAIEVVFKVTKNPTDQIEILKNIATMDYEFEDENIDIDSIPDEIDVDNYPDNENIEDDDDYEKIAVKPEKIADIALKKYITKVGNTNIDREPEVDTTPIKEGIANEKGQLNAIYSKETEPVEVNYNDLVTYAFRVYNEGEAKGFVYSITDYIPMGIEFMPEANEGFIEAKEEYTDEEIAENEYIYKIVENTITITRMDGSPLFELEAYDKVADELPSDVIEVVFKITKTQENEDKILVNEATIDYNFEDDFKDIDSNPGNYPDVKDEDDTDKEEVIIKGAPFDLSIQKFATEVNGEELKTSREPVVDITPLKEGKDDAKYTVPADPVVVKKGDIVKYKIRVYNEGERNGYATLISDTLPEGLGFICDYRENLINKWLLPESGIKTLKLVADDGLYKTEDEIENLKLEDFINIDNLSEVKIIKGEVKLTSEKENDLIEAYDGGTTLDYSDVEITCIVLADNLTLDTLTNTAKIEYYTDENKQDVEDRDTDDHEDDEVLSLKYFDLAIKKFASKVNSTIIENSEPTVTKNQDKTLTYKDSEKATSVANGDLVEFTIRVYNEGTISGYANEITDFIPKGLDYVAANETNKQYEWKMYYKNEEGKFVETDDEEKAEIIRTNYLSEEKEENIIDAFDFENENIPNYKDVKVVFKIDESEISKGNAERILTNKAAITEDSDKDEDSDPEDIETPEDDDDDAKVYVKKFDLSLEKKIVKSEVTVDGKTTITEIKNGLAKVEVDKKKVDKTTVKFTYEITIKNEGEIPGQATKITDFIPEGLEFNVEDNKDYGWVVEKDGKMVSTNILDGHTIKPGEEATVVIVLRWKQNKENLETKRNIAEITEDYNDKNSQDIDSTPNNVTLENYKDRQEDDDDYADILISLKTGSEKTYTFLALAVITIIASGIVLIKKYVL